ncbi:GNAT family N-acetyltransferase [Tenacibaculum aquimarinum]|uniref:GNAT family N-acetyltransferase n=1 Tax=Tenacibaculum aquimarinum TaxID=2910675 RepID=UPI001F0ADA5D|nr:GNAT family N-acetyltransferase [Tenacibaculum aquimarinum]MCH3884803.1 GNAT family N-acetyltransferase [Tenacibaculum aquimarinum]
MSFNFSSFPVLKTERLILRQSNLDDAATFLELRSNSIINTYIEREIPTKISQAEDFINKITQEEIDEKSITWLITLKENNTAIGSICIWNINHDNKYGEVGYSLLPEFFKKGFMSEAMETVLNFGFTKMNLKTIEAYTHKNNIASITLLEKYNFVFQPERKDDDVEDNRIYKIVNNK